MQFTTFFHRVKYDHEQIIRNYRHRHKHSELCGYYIFNIFTIRHKLYQRLPTTDSTGYRHWDTHKLQYVNTPRKFLVNIYLLLTSISAQSIKTVVSYLTLNHRCRFYHNKLVSALKHPIDWHKKWHKCLCEDVNWQAESFTAHSGYTLSTVIKKKKKRASGR